MIGESSSQLAFTVLKSPNTVLAGLTVLTDKDCSFQFF